MSDFLAYIGETASGIEKTVKDALEYLQWENIVYPNSVVFIKPNFTYPCYKEGITTSPLVLKSLLAVLRTRAKRVILGESDGGNHSFTAETAFKNHSMYDICGALGVELVNLSRLPARTVEDSIQGKKVSLRLPELLLDGVDCFIDVPVLKVHVMTEVTIGLKNLWGCVPDTMRGLYHQNLSHKLALLAKLFKPKITLVDATYALDKHGPMWGEPVKLDLLLAANSPVVADALGASIMGFAPQNIKHIKLAASTVPGTLNLDSVNMNRDWRPYQRKFTVQRTFIDRFSVLFFNSYLLSKLIFASPLTTVTYKIAEILRSGDEKRTATDLKKHGYFH